MGKILDVIGIVLAALFFIGITLVQVFIGSLFSGAVLVAIWQLITIGPTAMVFGLYMLAVIKFAVWATGILMVIMGITFFFGKRHW